MTRIVHVTPEDHIVGLWPGGKTRQMYIHPPAARYADKAFLFRLSLASMEQEECALTQLPDYHRFLFLQKGKLTLTMGDKPPMALSPLDIISFDGAELVHCRGKAAGIHLMLRKDKCFGNMYALHMPENGEFSFPLSCDTLAVYCIKGAAQIQAAKGFLLIKQEENVVITDRQEDIRMKALQSSAFLVAEIKLNIKE